MALVIDLCAVRRLGRIRGVVGGAAVRPSAGAEFGRSGSQRFLVCFTRVRSDRVCTAVAVGGVGFADVHALESQPAYGELDACVDGDS